MEKTILWHDYETWGVNPSVDFPAQFAAVRTDENLNVIEKSPAINWRCAIPHDYLPHPQACMVTGLSPLLSMQKGMQEPIFAEKIYRQMSRANTCVAGYNSLRFDDEVTRYLFHRNFYPVYDREYKNGNSRWDIIDLVRACYALRPEGITWPKYDNGKPCFKLELLSEANGIEHSNAHDALADVYATIALAKLIKEKQSKLYDYFWQLREKQNVINYLQRFQQTILVYISAYINADQGCCTLVMPVCPHPNNKNAVLCVDLNSNIDELMQDDPTALSTALFTKAKDDTKAPRIFSISVNKCPFVAPFNTLSTEKAESLSINIERCKHNYSQLKNKHDLHKLCQQVFTLQKTDDAQPNIDQSLYTIGFPSPADKTMMTKIRESSAENLVSFQGRFENRVYNDMLFRYRARNFPHLLEQHEINVWQEHLQHRFTLANKTECLSIQEYMNEIEELAIQYAQNPQKSALLTTLKRYGQALIGS